MLAGTLGGLLATWVTFAPCFLWIFLGGPYIEALRGNKALGAAGLPEHREPVRPAGGAPWMYIIGSYGCIHYLRRVAAYLALGCGMPEPDLPAASKDAVLRAYYSASRTVTRITPLPSRQPPLPLDWPPLQYTVVGGLPFSHLMHQSDCDGYYLPAPFPQVLVPDDPALTAYGGRIASSYALREECGELAERLRFPRQIALRALDEMRSRAGEYAHRPGWERYVVECFVCQALLTAAEISIRSGCALRFG